MRTTLKSVFLLRGSAHPVGGGASYSTRLNPAPTAVTRWMSKKNDSRLNAGRTELIILGSERRQTQFKDVTLCFEGSAITQVSCAKSPLRPL